MRFGSLPSRLGLLVLILLAHPLAAAEVKILMPLQRTVYQTNEWIDVSVVRSDSKDLPVAFLSLLLEGSDGSRIVTLFEVPAAPLRGRLATRTEHLHLSGWLLRPGKYRLTASDNDGDDKVSLDIVSHLRQSSFRLVNWGRAKDGQQLLEGEDSFGFNLYYGDETNANLLRAGVDAMGVCVMSGGHQMDLRMECDWSDPYVTRGGTRRVVRRAFADRTRPNVPGVHFYDEPGLTWHKHPVTGEFTPHEVPAQVRSYVAAYGQEPIPHFKLDAKNPEHSSRWQHWATWKLGLMDAAWKESQFGVSQVRPDFLSLTQSQYGWNAFTDGYYFNVARSLPITSGHGGYHDYGPGFFNPSWFLEMARARDMWKPCWYLPCWYGNTTSDQFRLEQYLSFQTGIQGLISPPDCEPATNPSARAGIVESNQLMKRLGPIFTTMSVTKPPVAMLYSLSQAIHSQEQDTKKNYLHEQPQGRNLAFTYLAGKLSQQPFLPVLDEDVLDGTVADDHKAIVLTSIDHLDPQVIRAVEDFAKRGGLVLLTGDSTVKIEGAIKLAVTPGLPDQGKIADLNEQIKRGGDEKTKQSLQRQLARLQDTAHHLAGALPLAQAIRAELEKKGIRPLIESSVPSIAVTRQGAGDVDYLFAVNATPEADKDDEKGNPLTVTPRAVRPILTLPQDDRSVYDAVRSGPVVEFGATGKRSAEFSFGPGEMRVFALTTRPIGGVKLATPIVTRELVVEKTPIRLDVTATVVDDKGGILAGSIPLHITVHDPLGSIRHELFRATKQGQFAITLPLAVNDPPGSWRVVVRELLSGREGSETFKYAPPPHARAIAGATRRAVSFGDDAERVFRFARTHHEVTIVKGKSAFNDVAAKRLAKILEPWDIRCKELDLTEAAKARTLTAAEAETWIGLDYAGKGQIKAGDKNSPLLAGFAVRGPVILLGNPEDNPLIDFLAKQKFLPYAPNPMTFPGVGRGLFAWQRDGIGAGQESLTLIAYDDEGMAEAVGSVYEAVAGLEPLTRWALPRVDALEPAKSDPNRHAAAKVAWTATLPDRVTLIKITDQEIVASTHDGAETVLSGAGQVKRRKPAPAAPAETPLAVDKAWTDVAKKQERPDRLLKLTAAGEDQLALAYWGGTIRVVNRAGEIRIEERLPQDVTALAWQGSRLIVGLADGRVRALQP